MNINVNMVLVKTALLLVLSNCFMTFAWYGHLKSLSNKPWIIAVLISWGIAFFEYLIQVPANRIGYQTFTATQLKIIQEAISLGVFCLFAAAVLGERLRWNHILSFVLVLGAVWLAFLKPRETPATPLSAPPPAVTADSPAAR